MENTVAAATPTKSALRPASWWHLAKTGVAIVRLRMKENQTFQLAAALAYNTLFSLLPTVVLALLVLSIIGNKVDKSSNEQLGEVVQNWMLTKLGLNQITITLDNKQQDLSNFLSERIEQFRVLVQSPGTGLIGFGTLLWASISLMRAIERTFNKIYEVSRQRTWVYRGILYWSVLTLGPIGVGLSIYLTRAAATLAESTTVGVWLWTPFAAFGGFAASWLLLSILYRIAPDTEVRWQSAFVGGFFGAVLWELGKTGFGMYVHYAIVHSTGYAKWYGNLAAVPMFMVWLYLTWIFVLLGLEIAFTHQHFKLLAQQAERARKSNHLLPSLTDVRVVLPIAVLLYHRFQQGQSVSSSEAADELNIDPEISDWMFRALQDAGLIHRVRGRDGQYALAKPPESITADDLLAVGDGMWQTTHDLATAGTAKESPLLAPGIVELQEAEREWRRSHTLVSLAKGQSQRVAVKM